MMVELRLFSHTQVYQEVIEMSFAASSNSERPYLVETRGLSPCAVVLMLHCSLLRDQGGRPLDDFLMAIIRRRVY